MSTTNKGSLLVYPLVEVRWSTSGGELLQDTFIELSNDYPAGVCVQLYYVNGDPPLDAAGLGMASSLTQSGHPGFNKVGNRFCMSASQATYWSVASGLPQGMAPLGVLDPGDPPGRPDPEHPSGGAHILRGYLVVWAVDYEGKEIRWNHLSGGATIVDYEATSGWTYSPWSFQTKSASHGMEPVNCRTLNLDSGQCVDGEVVSGRLQLDGYEYDSCPDKLLFHFHTIKTMIPTPEGSSYRGVDVDTKVLLLPCDMDLRQDGEGPVVTKAVYDIWNENGVHFSGTERCVVYWDFTSLGAYTDIGVVNSFWRDVLHTDLAKARVQGMASGICETEGGVSRDAALLGMVMKRLEFGGRLGVSGAPMAIQGYEAGHIYYDVVESPDEKRDLNTK